MTTEGLAGVDRAATPHQAAGTADLAGIAVTFRCRGAAHVPPALPGGWKAVVVSLDGGSLTDIAKRYKQLLLHSSVRYAHGRRQERIGPISLQMATTEAARSFWVYNNGLTVLCDEFELQGGSDGQDGTVRILNPQVINGCRTVDAFRSQHARFGCDAAVLARIITLTGDSRARDAHALAISRRTNTQLPVLAGELCAASAVQKSIQASFRALSPAWYYEIRQGEWAALSQTERDTYAFRVSMDLIGQCGRMIDEPAEALTRKTDLFEDDAVYSRVFRRGRTAEAYLFPYLCRQYFERFWNGRRIEAIRRLCAFSDARLRGLLGVRNRVVSHAVALTKRILQTGDRWTADDAAFAFELFRRADVDAPGLKSFNRYIAIAFRCLVTDLEEANQEREAKGKDACSLKERLEQEGQTALRFMWSRLSSDASLILGPNWRSELIDRSANAFNVMQRRA